MDSLKSFMVFASRNAYLFKNYNMCMQACRINFPNGGICIHRCRIHSNTACIGIQECRIRCKNSGICIQGYSTYQTTKIFMSNTYHVWPMSGYTILDFLFSSHPDINPHQPSLAWKKIPELGHHPGVIRPLHWADTIILASSWKPWQQSSKPVHFELWLLWAASSSYELGWSS